jgi:2-dehydro-3-deoxyphosphogluconate aldolase/(4S)-4-hydroxy-2-oxoglutarate aldolase
MCHKELLSLLRQDKLIAICRGAEGDTLLSLAAAICAGGIRFIEVTFQQERDDCADLARQNIKALCGMPGIIPGAGTVLSPDQVRAAYEAGAKYIVSPNTDPAVIAETKRLGLMSIPGALTPSEIMAAHNAGADLVKLFPTATMGLKYFKDLRAPLSHIGLVVTAGITPDNLGDYLKAGAFAAGISSPLCDKELMAAGDFAEITRRARAFRGIANPTVRA